MIYFIEQVDCDLPDVRSVPWKLLPYPHGPDSDVLIARFLIGEVIIACYVIDGGNRRLLQWLTDTTESSFTKQSHDRCFVLHSETPKCRYMFFSG